MLVLASDTSTKTASVALLEGDSLVAEYLVNIKKHHGETFLPEIITLLDSVDVTVDDIDLFAVTLGPGSFTGLRIGVSTIKGLALATGKPVVGVSTLEALAMNLPQSMIAVCPMLDARKQEVYTALYRPDENGFPVKIIEETVTDPVPFVEALQGDVIFVGDGAMVYRNVITEAFPYTSYFASGPLNCIRGSSAGLIGLKKFHDGDTLDLLGFTPQYLRLSEAEMKRFLKK